MLHTRDTRKISKDDRCAIPYWVGRDQVVGDRNAPGTAADTRACCNARSHHSASLFNRCPDCERGCTVMAMLQLLLLLVPLSSGR